METETIYSSLTLFRDPRIIGGISAYAGQYPYAAAINVQTGTSKFFCGGTLIDSQWVLTAGQCVDGAILFTIQLGSHKLEGDDPYRVTVATSHSVLHPDYNPLTLENDIGLIELRIPVEYSHTLNKITYFAFNITEPRDMWAIGWGQISDDSPELYNELQTVDVAPLTTEECRIYYGNQISDNTVCVEGNYNEGTCYGDTGSPLVVDLGRGYKSVGGVASFVSGNGCESTEPSGYLRTAPYESWIKNVTGL
ncbi:hypothetical protein Zmor_015482 [Zophobas morio]|uniref:Peptidase S1 domain-containing protein n=1 Tax=Zophobas morio TaxID=2755281 RepID=A0AA38IGW7_9CUCU|nr:hypothetical protein Zmor_015482 [Zophobas morio]